MPITINGSGTVTGISAGGLPDDCITTAEIAAGAVTDAKVNASAAIADSKLSGTTCKAWVNFNGTGTVAIRASYNVSSITDNGVGLYKVNFTAAMPDTNYSNVGGAGHTSGDYSRYVGFNGVQTTSGVELRVAYPVTDGVTDSERICVAVFR
jgi:hypothetical protein